jgi:hypothetical protein
VLKFKKYPVIQEVATDELVQVIEPVITVLQFLQRIPSRKAIEVHVISAEELQVTAN